MIWRSGPTTPAYIVSVRDRCFTLYLGAFTFPGGPLGLVIRNACRTTLERRGHSAGGAGSCPRGRAPRGAVGGRMAHPAHPPQPVVGHGRGARAHAPV